MPTSRARLIVLALAAVAALAPGRARAQSEETVALAPVVSDATLLPEPASDVGSAVADVSGGDIARLQTQSLAYLLGTLADVPVFATGQAGAASSVFLRGSDSDQTLFLVDGVRFNDANTDYGVFLGEWRATPADRIEVVYGPQSTLYGAEAVGGVISLTLARGTGAPTANVAVDGGSFGTVEGSLAAQGASGQWAYDVAAAGGHTDNARPNNAWNSGNAALRLDAAITPNLSVGATVRGLDSRYGDPGDIYTNSLTDYEAEQDVLATLYAEAHLSDNFTAKLTVGGLDRQLDASSFGTGSETLNRRGVATGQLTCRLTASDQLVVGGDLEDERTSDDSFGVIDHGQRLLAIFAEDQFEPVQDVYVTGGLRRDDYDTFGAADTGRATLAWLGEGREIKLRASYGTGFDSPSFLELYSTSPEFAGNPALRPEWSRGWDVGFDAYLPQNQTLSFTWFRTNYTNLIDTDFSVNPATSVNIDQARSDGVEVALQAPWGGAIQSRISYTYLRAFDLATDTPLLRRPRQMLSADFWLDAGRGWTVGVDGNYVGQRADIDAFTYEDITDPGYTVFREYMAWQATSRLKLSFRVENALDAVYQPVNGYPALGRGYFGGADWRF